MRWSVFVFSLMMSLLIRHDLSANLATAEASSITRAGSIGQLFAFILGLSIVVDGVWLGSRGFKWVGTTIAGFGLTGLAIAFLNGQEV